MGSIKRWDDDYEYLDETMSSLTWKEVVAAVAFSSGVILLAAALLPWLALGLQIIFHQYNAYLAYVLQVTQ